MNGLENISIFFSPVNDDNLISLLPYGDYKFDDKKNRKILVVTIKFIKDSQTFDVQPF